MTGLFLPGADRADGVADDAAWVDSMLRVEVAWVRALARVGALETNAADAIARTVDDWQPGLTALVAATESAGNPVVPLVARLRERVSAPLATKIHRGLTSQDVLDTALVLLARDALVRIRGDLLASARALATLAERHRDSIMVGRTLTQHAVPITFGLKAAQWLAGVLAAIESIDRTVLPVQCGGAAGTLSLAAELTSPLELAEAFADELGLTWPGLPWATNRAPITAIAHALVSTTDALGLIASNVALLSRPEIDEVREGHVAGRGGSSTMPHKRNPILAVLIRSASLQAPALLTQLHLAATQSVDERPDGAWHSEWPAVVRLLELTVVAASQAAELVSLLEVNVEVMSARVEMASAELLAESSTASAPQDYLGATSSFIDTVLARVPDEGPTHA